MEKFHKVKVELVAPDGGPLTVLDQKGKKQKYVYTPAKGTRRLKVALAIETSIAAG